MVGIVDRMITSDSSNEVHANGLSYMRGMIVRGDSFDMNNIIIGLIALIMILQDILYKSLLGYKGHDSVTLLSLVKFMMMLWAIWQHHNSVMLNGDG